MTLCILFQITYLCSFVLFRICLYWGVGLGILKVFLRTFLLPKPDIPDICNQPTSDLNKSVKAGLFRAFTHTIAENTSDCKRTIGLKGKNREFDSRFVI